MEALGHLEPQPAVLTHPGGPSHGVKLDVLDGVTQGSSASVADRGLALDLDDRHGGDLLDGIASELAFGVDDLEGGVRQGQETSQLAEGEGKPVSQRTYRQHAGRMVKWI